MRNLGPFLPFILLALFLQQWTVNNFKTRKGGGQPFFWKGLEHFRVHNIKSLKRGELLKPHIIQGFQIWKTNFEKGKSGWQQPLLWK